MVDERDDQKPLKPQPKTAGEIEAWISAHVADKLQCPPSELRLDRPLVDIGLDSVDAMALVGELEEWLGCQFCDNPLIDYPSIRVLSIYLADELAQGHTMITPVLR